MKIVVAGSSGLAGSAIVRKFRILGKDVIGINRSVVNLLDERETLAFIESIKPYMIIDAAAKVGGIGANSKFPVEFLSENLLIQTNLMKAAFAHNVEKFIFLGSSCIYPRDCAQPIKEEYLMTGPLEPSNSGYAVAKIAGIEMIRSYRKEYGVNWISLMPTNLYGPNDNFKNGESHVLPAFIRRFIEATESNSDSVRMWGTGSPLREFLHADDLANAVAMASEKYDSDEHLNIGSGIEISIKNLAELVANICNFKGHIEWDKSMPDGTPRKVLDISKAAQIGWAPTISLEEGIASTVDWYREADALGKVRK